tara:strand:+ start:2286 stop:3203 length:918 start_codon:yes stop_codon:yes gene_type:complete
MVVKNNAEFGVELALAVPYAYWLHKQGQLETVITSKGMRPFYYFCNDVREEFTHRTIDNAAAGLNELPNNWIHGDTKAGTVSTKPGVLDYSKWKLPPYKNHYGTGGHTRPTVFLTNIYNHPDNSDARHYHHFSIQSLYEIFSVLAAKGYDVIYKRERNVNKEITFDQNEINATHMQNDIVANVDGYGVMTDFDLTNHFENVYLFEDKVNESSLSYNEVQLKILADCDKYISVCGGSGILSSCFNGTVILYITQGKELRPNYFSEEGYFHQLSKAKILPVIDLVEDIKKRGHHDVSGVIKLIQEEF